MNKNDLEIFKNKLLAEKSVLEKDLSPISKQNPANPKEWQATSGGITVDAADENEVADKLEEYEDNSGIVTQLENQLNDVKSALERIEKGTYGLCAVCGKPIEKDRLEANPAAKISIKHGH